MVNMINPQGEIVEVPESKVERNLTRGYSLSNTKIEEDSHEEIDIEEEEV
jgi:hypothetical protein